MGKFESIMDNRAKGTRLATIAADVKNVTGKGNAYIGVMPGESGKISQNQSFYLN